MRIKIQTVIMSHQLKLNCPICKYPKLTNLSRHLTTVHGINGQERKTLLLRARFSVFSRQPDHSQPSIPEANFYTDDQIEDNLIPCPYDSCISYERIWVYQCSCYGLRYLQIAPSH